MFSVKVNLMTWKNKIKLPTIKIRDQSGKVCNVPVENSYECLAGHDGQLVGEFFENIVSEIDATIQNNHFSGILVYGNGGCGKTRILYESSRNLIARDYKVLDFTGFDNGNNWINVIREIIFCVFSVSGDMVLEMISSIEAELPLECSKQSNYVNDHIGVQAAEKYYDKAHDTIKSLKETTPEMLEELFSFYIHDAENKIHLSMSNKVLELYSDVVCHAKRKKLTSKIQKIRQGKQHLGGLKLYLNGFIKPFNQTIKHCISIIDTKKASHALLCGVCTNHYNIDGNSLIANFLYKIQYKY